MKSISHSPTALRAREQRRAWRARNVETMLKKTEALLLLGIGAAALSVSAIRPFDWLTWWLEVALALLAVAVLFVTCRRFPFTPFVYGWCCCTRSF